MASSLCKAQIKAWQATWLWYLMYVLKRRKIVAPRFFEEIRRFLVWSVPYVYFRSQAMQVEMILWRGQAWPIMANRAGPTFVFERNDRVKSRTRTQTQGYEGTNLCCHDPKFMKPPMLLQMNSPDTINPATSSRAKRYRFINRSFVTRKWYDEHLPYRELLAQ